MASSKIRHVLRVPGLEDDAGRGTGQLRADPGLHELGQRARQLVEPAGLARGHGIARARSQTRLNILAYGDVLAS